MLTNRLGLPDAMVRAVANDPYTRGDSDISVTQLIAPPYQRRLRESVEPVEDAADRMWSLLGQATHAILERAYPAPQGGMEPELGKLSMPEQYLANGGWLREERLFKEIDGWRVSGAFDVYERRILKDYKVTSVWSVIGETKIEWEQQLNLLRVLAEANGLPVQGLQIIAILRDWSKAKAKVSSEKDYPKLPVQVVEIPLWNLDRAQMYLGGRLAQHKRVDPDPCNDEERWKSEDVFAVMKEGRKSAVKLHDTSKAAEDHANELGKGHSVTKRPGEYKRCADYCSVAHACQQYKGEVLF